MAPGSAMFIDNSIRTRVKESYVRTFNNTHRQGVLELDRKFCKEFNWKKNISLVPSFGGCLFLFHLHFWRFYSGESMGVYPLTKHSHKSVLVVRLVSNGDRTKQGQGVRAFDCNNGKLSLKFRSYRQQKTVYYFWGMQIVNEALFRGCVWGKKEFRWRVKECAITIWS